MTSSPVIRGRIEEGQAPNRSVRQFQIRNRRDRPCGSPPPVSSPEDGGGQERAVGSSYAPTKSSTSSSVGKRPVLLRVYLSAPSTVTSNWPDLPTRSSMSAAPSFWRLSLTRRACGL